MMKSLRILIVTLAVVLMLVACAYNNIDFNSVERVETEQSEQPPVKSPKPTDKKFEAEDLIVMSRPEKYTYDNLMYDISLLQEMYGEIIQVTKLCETVDGRDVCDIIIGNQQGDNQILIFGAMHAREYITTQLVMRQLIDCLKVLSDAADEEYRGISKKELLQNITIHFVPMSNPDGVSISQFGLDGINSDHVRSAVEQMNCDDYRQWKANAEGVDLNRNFDVGWYEYEGAMQPSFERYKGEYPGSANEADALIKLTEDYKFDRTISYHTCGALIYWYYLQEGEVLEASRAFAKELSDETGYILDENYQAVDAAGYKDWAVYQMGIPSVTIEVGNENGGGIVNPVPISNFPNIWNRNKNVVYATAYNLKYGT